MSGSRDLGVTSIRQTLNMCCLFVFILLDTILREKSYKNKVVMGNNFHQYQQNEQLPLPSNQ
jgi:hypothetical protein